MSIEPGPGMAHAFAWLRENDLRIEREAIEQVRKGRGFTAVGPDYTNLLPPHGTTNRWRKHKCECDICAAHKKEILKRDYEEAKERKNGNSRGQIAGNP